MGGEVEGERWRVRECEWGGAGKSGERVSERASERIVYRWAWDEGGFGAAPSTLDSETQLP